MTKITVNGKPEIKENLGRYKVNMGAAGKATAGRQYTSSRKQKKGA